MSYTNKETQSDSCTRLPSVPARALGSKPNAPGLTAELVEKHLEKPQPHPRDTCGKLG